MAKKVTESSGNIFLDLGFPPHEAEVMLLRAKLAEALRVWMEREELTQAESAKRNGLKVFVIDTAGDPKSIDALHQRSVERGFVGFAVPSADFQNLEIPRYPARPVNENALSILSLGNVKNFLYLSESVAFGRMDEYAITLHGTNYDMVVVDFFHGRDPLNKQAIATLKYKKAGGRRLALAHIDIGSVASYRYYWKPNWREGSPGWISAPIPGDSDRFFVEYWRPEWKSIISGDANSYVYGAVDLGFDGVVLSGIDTYRYFETGESGQAAQ